MKKACAFILVVGTLLSLLAPSAHADLQRLEQHCDKASGDVSIDACSQLLNKKRHVAWAYMNRGIAFLEKKEFEKSIKDFTNSIKLNPSDPAAFGNRGIAWLSLGNSARAISDQTEAIRLAPRTDTNYHNRGLAYYAAGSYKNSIADFRKAIKLNPSNSKHFNGLANSLLETGELNQALTNYSISIRLDSNNYISYFNRGTARLRNNQNNEALSDFGATIELNPTFAPAYNNRSIAWKRIGDSGKALSDASRAIKLDPDHVFAYRNRASLYFRERNYEKAERDLKEAIRLEPSNKNTLELLQLTRRNIQTQLLRVTRKPSLQPPDYQTIDGTNTDPKRVALIIGVNKYRFAPPLTNPRNDAALIAGTLREVGFDSVTLKVDLTRDELVSALNDFSELAQQADWAIIYFAGHGMELSGINYMLPIDAKIEDAETVSDQSVNLEYFLSSAARAKALRLIIIDACRDNPFVDSLGLGKPKADSLTAMSYATSNGGLSSVEPEPGTMVMYSAKHGQVALDGDKSNSFFADALAKRIAQNPPVELRRLLEFVRKDVFIETDKRQQPFTYGTLEPTEDFFFLPAERVEKSKKSSNGLVVAP